VLAVAQAFLAERGIEHEVTLDAPLGPKGLGLDSVGRLDLLSRIEEQCEVQIPERYWGSKPLRSLNHLIDVAR